MSFVLCVLTFYGSVVLMKGGVFARSADVWFTAGLELWSVGAPGLLRVLLPEHIGT